MQPKRRIIETIHPPRRVTFDQQFWPVAIALAVTTGITVGAILTLLRGPWMWASLIAMPIAALVALAALYRLDDQRLKRSIQLAVILSFAVHLLVLIVTSLTSIFGRPQPDSTTVVRRPQRTVTIRNRSTPFVWQRTNQKPTPEPRVETQRTTTTPTQPTQPTPVETPEHQQVATAARNDATRPTVARHDRQMSPLHRQRRMAKPVASAPAAAASNQQTQPVETERQLEPNPSQNVEVSRRAPATRAETASARSTMVRPAETNAQPDPPLAERRAEANVDDVGMQAPQTTAPQRRSTPRIPESTARANQPASTPRHMTEPTPPSQTPSVKAPSAEARRSEIARTARPAPPLEKTVATAEPQRETATPHRSSRRTPTPQAATLSHPDSTATTPRRSARVAPRATTKVPRESPEAIESTVVESRPPAPRSVAISRSVTGTAGLGRSANLEKSIGGMPSPATSASSASAKRRTVRPDTETVSLTAQQKSSTGLRRPSHQRPTTAVPAQSRWAANRAASRQPALQTRTAAAAAADSTTRARPDTMAAEKGNAAVESGATKLVAEPTATRRGGGGQPEPQLTADPHSAPGGRQRSERRPMLSAPVARAAAAPANPVSRPESGDSLAPNRSADLLARHETESNSANPNTDRSVTESANAPTGAAQVQPPAAASRRSTDSSLTESIVDNQSDTQTRRGQRAFRLAQAPRAANLAQFGQPNAPSGPADPAPATGDAIQPTDIVRRVTSQLGGSPPAAIERVEMQGASDRSVREQGQAGPRRTPNDLAAIAEEDNPQSRHRRASRSARPQLSGTPTTRAEPQAARSDQAMPNAVAEGVALERKANMGRNEAGMQHLIEATPGPAGLADGDLPRLGIPDRPASENSLQLALEPTTRFRRESSAAAPAIQPATALAKQPFRSRDPGTIGRGEPVTEAAIHAGLEFLARYQNPDGHWSLADFDREQPLHRYQIDSDTAATGLALLAFQGAGYNHREFKYANRMQQAIDWLIAHQAPDGGLFVESDPTSNASARMYSHAIATLALAEAYGMTQDPRLEPPVRRAMGYIASTQDPRRGGWRYFAEPQRRSTDTSVTGWMLMALKSGQLAGLEVDPQTRAGIDKWLNMARDVDKEFRFRYNPFAKDGSGVVRQSARQPTRSMTAVGLLMRVYGGWSKRDERFQAGAQALLEQLPSHTDSRRRDTYYWYYATQVLRHAGGDSWQQWNAALHPLLVESQISSGPLAGSWNPYAPVPDRWGAHGGRLYVTTMNLLSLEVDYRLLPLYEQTVDSDADGSTTTRQDNQGN